MDPVPRSKLPTFGNNDGDQVIDSVGNIYEYDANTRSWLYRGASPAPPIVDEELDGLIGPDVFRKLSLLQQLLDSGLDFSNFKLATEAGNPYYYYFNSSDDLIRFTPEKLISPKETQLSSTVIEIGVQNEDTFLRIQDANFSSKTLVGLSVETDLGNYKIVDNSRDVVVIDGNPDLRVGDRVRIVKLEQIQTRLRIEIDRGRLYQKLIRRCCIGPKGKKGEKGLSGPNGASAANEVFQLPVNTTGESFVWSTNVSTPIDTPISLRLFRSLNAESHAIELLYSIAGTETTTIIIVDETVQIEETSIEVDYEPTSGLFTGSITVLQGGEDLDNWVYKARQQGPQGPKGQEGNAFLQIVTQLLDDPTVRSTEAIITARKAIASDDIITLRAPLFEFVPASNLAAFDGDSVNDILTDRFMAAKITIREARDVQQFLFVPPEFDTPNLDLPQWTPTKDCVQSRRWVQYRFDWFDRVEPKYLFQILPTPKPPEQCCQEDFFFCPNLGDACPPEGEILPPRPIPVPCECECPNPLSGAFFGGSLILNPIILTDPDSFVDQNDPNNQGAEEDLSEVVIEDPNAIIPLDEVKASGINVIESVLDGTIQTFEQEITFLGDADIRVVLEYDADICGGIEAERGSKAFVDSDAISSMISLNDSTKQAVISNDGLWETNTIPVAVAFTVQGPVMQTEDAVPETSPGEVAVPANEIDNSELTPEEISETTTCATPVTIILTVQVNTEEANYCRGFRLTIVARSNRIEPKILRTFIIGDPETILPPLEDLDSPIIPIPDPPPPLLPPDPPPFLPPESFAPTATIIASGTAEDAPTSFIALSSGGSFILTYPLNGGSLAIISENNALLTFDFGELIGQLVNSPGPSQVPIHQDLLNFNTNMAINGLALNPLDAGFDSDGLFGPGTYLLGGNFVSTFNSIIPFVNVRTDQWDDVIGFINQPQTAEEPESLVIIGRIESSNLISPANSVFANELFDSGLTEGVITIVLTNPSQSIIGSFEAGEIVTFDTGSVSLSYYDNQLAELYPQILITPTPPGSDPGSVPSSGSSTPPPISCVGTISNLDVTPASTEISTTTSYEIELTYDFEIPVEANFIIDFDADIDISGVTSGSISSPDLDGSFSASIALQQLMISRVDGTNMPTGTATIFVGDITNPISSGSYSIDVTVEDGDTAEVCDGPVNTSIAITATPISTISGFVVTPDITTVGTSGVTYDIAFDSDGLIQSDDILIFSYPAGFDITSATFSSSTLDGTFTVVDVGQDLVVTRNGDGTIALAGTISAEIGDVINSSTIGTYSLSLEVQDSGMSNLAGPTSSSTFGIVASIDNMTVEASDISLSSPSDYTITFDIDGDIPNDAKFIVEFSPGFDLTTASTVSSPDFDGTFSISDAGDIITIERNGDGTATLAGTDLEFTFGTITNSADYDYSVSLGILNGSDVEISEIEDHVREVYVEVLTGPTGGDTTALFAIGDTLLHALSEVLVTPDGAGTMPGVDAYSVGILADSDKWGSSSDIVAGTTTGPSDYIAPAPFTLVAPAGVIVSPLGWSGWGIGEIQITVIYEPV